MYIKLLTVGGTDMQTNNKLIINSFQGESGLQTDPHGLVNYLKRGHEDPDGYTTHSQIIHLIILFRLLIVRIYLTSSWVENYTFSVFFKIQDTI